VTIGAVAVHADASFGSGADDVEGVAAGAGVDSDGCDGSSLAVADGVAPVQAVTASTITTPNAPMEGWGTFAD
jgi:hypothetical protein